MTSRHVSCGVAAAVSAAALVVTASAAAPSVTLNLKGGNANRELVACGIRHHYTFFHVAKPLSMDGSVQPVPRGTWLVKVKVKKCIRGRFRTVWARHAKGKADGTFKMRIRPAAPARTSPARTFTGPALPREATSSTSTRPDVGPAGVGFPQSTGRLVWRSHVL